VAAVIERFQFAAPEIKGDEPKELMLLSIISQSFFQPFSIEDNLLVTLTALTSGSGVGFNRAMLFRVRNGVLKGEVWLGPRSAEEAKDIWEVLSTPGIGYIEILEHNRMLLSQNGGSLSERIRSLAYPLGGEDVLIPTLAAAKKEVLLVKNAREEPLIDRKFLEIIGVDEFLVVPLLSAEDVFGTIVLDNAYSRTPIGHKDITLASLCGLMAGNYIYATTYHAKMVEMERLAALGEMAMYITHQLRNPLAAIGGFTDQLLTSPSDERRKKRNLEIIRKEIRRLEETLAKLALFVKADLKNAFAFDLGAALKVVLRSAELQTRSAGIIVESDIPEDLPWVLGDPTYAGEALRNVMDNAFEATPEGGRVTIRVRSERPDWVHVDVQDSGKGMPPDILEKAFLPFFSTKDSGMGFGLLYVKRVMESFGGRTEVESEPGKGTLFRLSFKTAREGRLEP
jgi:signal transduction histidine kinase